MKLLILADAHCGTMTGLTHPDYWKDSAKSMFHSFQRDTWKWFESVCKKIKPDVVVCNGDMIDGQGKASGGTEQLTVDWEEQAEMAAKVVMATGAKKYHIIRGTPYHTGKDGDYENLIRHHAPGCVGVYDQTYLDANGLVFHFKHKVSGSAIPHGRHTGPQREALWNAFQSERGTSPAADVLIRSHVHYHTYGGDAKRLTITTPCLEGSTKYGSKECTGIVDYGVTWFDIKSKTDWRWGTELMDFGSSEKIEVKKL